MYVNCHVLWSDRMYGEICAETCHKFESGVAARVTMFVHGWVWLGHDCFWLGHDCSNVTGLCWVDRMMGRVELGHERWTHDHLSGVPYFPRLGVWKEFNQLK